MNIETRRKIRALLPRALLPDPAPKYWNFISGILKLAKTLRSDYKEEEAFEGSPKQASKDGMLYLFSIIVNFLSVHINSSSCYVFCVVS